MQANAQGNTDMKIYLEIYTVLCHDVCDKANSNMLRKELK